VGTANRELVKSSELAGVDEIQVHAALNTLKTEMVKPAGQLDLHFGNIVHGVFSAVHHIPQAKLPAFINEYLLTYLAISGQFQWQGPR
jgi:hydroxymethylglutaryl-CoA reductase